MSKLSIQEIEQEYSILKSAYDKFNKSLLAQIENVLERENVSLGFPIQSRIKTLDSIRDKVQNGRFTIKKSLQELQDIAGLRIILLFKKDVEIVSQLLNSHLDVVKQYSSNQKLLDNQFGYSSEHFIVKIPKEWMNIPTFKGLENYIAEIQLRTLSQHTWAEASKELQYKHEDSVPRPLLRSIGRVSALLETVDLEFERLLFERAQYKSEISNENSDANQKLNVDLLAAILDANLPKQNKKDDEPYAELVRDLEKFGILTQNDLESLIKKQIENVLAEDIRVATTLHNSKTGGLFFAHVGLIRTMMEFEDKIKWEAIKDQKWGTK